MKITTWNINSVRLRIDQVVKFLETEKPDVLCLQEIKCTEDQFPSKKIVKAGYPNILIVGQSAYHGVAIVSRLPMSPSENFEFCKKGEARHISAYINDSIEIHNFYIPAGGDEPDPLTNEKFAHKLDFLERLHDWGQSLKSVSKRNRILVGDLNVAPDPDDVWSHKQLLKVVSHTPIEVSALEKAQAGGQWTDIARELIPGPEKLFSWWSYRARDWRVSNRGRRLDHIWLSSSLKKAGLAAGRNAYCIHDDVRGWEKPSDHAPVSMTLEL